MRWQRCTSAAAGTPTELKVGSNDDVSLYQITTASALAALPFAANRLMRVTGCGCDSGRRCPGWVQVNVCARMSICSAETRAIRLVCAQKRGCASRIPPRKTWNLFDCERCASSARACLGCNRRLARLCQFRQTPAFRSTSTTQVCKSHAPAAEKTILSVRKVSEVSGTSNHTDAVTGLDRANISRGSFAEHQSTCGVSAWSVSE